MAWFYILPRSSLVYRLFMGATTPPPRFDLSSMCFRAYDYNSRRASLRAMRIAFWKYLSLIRDWLPPWKQQLLPHLSQTTHSQPISHPLRLLSAITVRRERFQWKRKMVLRFLKPSETP